MTLCEFEETLAELIGRPTDLWPFVCEGSPLRRDVSLPGFNPATPCGWSEERARKFGRSLATGKIQ